MHAADEYTFMCCFNEDSSIVNGNPRAVQYKKRPATFSYYRPLISKLK